MQRKRLEFMAPTSCSTPHLVNILSGIRLVLIVRRCFHPFLRRCSWLSPRQSQLACSTNMHQAYHKSPEGRGEKEKGKVKNIICILSSKANKWGEVGKVDHTKTTK
jgi:hypothetical protein